MIQCSMYRTEPGNTFDVGHCVHLHVGHHFNYSTLFEVSLLLGSMYIWTLLNQLSRSCNYIGENSWYWKRKKISDIRWCQNHRLSEGFHPLFPESVLTSLFQLEKWQKRVFQVWLSMALWPKTCPPPQAWDHLTLGKKKICCHIKNELVAATFVNLIFRT